MLKNTSFFLFKENHSPLLRVSLRWRSRGNPELRSQHRLNTRSYTMPPLVIQSEAWNLAAPPRTRGTPYVSPVTNAVGYFALRFAEIKLITTHKQLKETGQAARLSKKIPRCAQWKAKAFQTSPPAQRYALNDNRGVKTRGLNSLFSIFQLLFVQTLSSKL